jgi:hypothetical protein
MQVDDVGEDTISQLTPLLKAGKQHTEAPLCLAGMHSLNSILAVLELLLPYTLVTQ